MTYPVGPVSGRLQADGTLRGRLSGGGTLSGGLSTAVAAIGLEPATTTTLGGIIVGQDLLITEEGVLSVDKANIVEQDNTKPITAAAVYTEVGNIDVLLQTI